MDEKIQFNLVGIITAILLIAGICAGIVYYYRGASGELESELNDLERLNSEIASESRQLQAGIASHCAGIKAVRGEVRTSRKRVEHIYSELNKSANDADRAIQIIKECESIIEAVKAQR